MAGNERRAVFDAGAPLQQRFEQIAGDAERDDDHAEGEPEPEDGTAVSHHAPAPARTAVPTTKPPRAPSMVFFGLIAGASGRRPRARPV